MGIAGPKQGGGDELGDIMRQAMGSGAGGGRQPAPKPVKLTPFE